MVSRTYLIVLTFKLDSFNQFSDEVVVTNFQLHFFCVKTNKSRDLKMQAHATKEHNNDTNEMTCNISHVNKPIKPYFTFSGLT